MDQRNHPTRPALSFSCRSLQQNSWVYYSSHEPSVHPPELIHPTKDPSHLLTSQGQVSVPKPGIPRCFCILPELQGHVWGHASPSASIAHTRGPLDSQLPRALSPLPHTQKHHPQLSPTPAPLYPCLVPPMAPATKSMDSVGNGKDSGLSLCHTGQLLSIPQIRYSCERRRRQGCKQAILMPTFTQPARIPVPMTPASGKHVRGHGRRPTPDAGLPLFPVSDYAWLLTTHSDCINSDHPLVCVPHFTVYLQS